MNVIILLSFSALEVVHNISRRLFLSPDCNLIQIKKRTCSKLIFSRQARKFKWTKQILDSQSIRSVFLPTAETQLSIENVSYGLFITVHYFYVYFRFPSTHFFCNYIFTFHTHIFIFNKLLSFSYILYVVSTLTTDCHHFRNLGFSPPPPSPHVTLQRWLS